MLFPTTPPPAVRVQSSFQQCYPGAGACLKKHGITHQFQPGPAGFPEHSTLVLWREVPGYRYKLGVRPSGEVLAATGQVLSPVELEALVGELGTRWQRKAQRADTYLQSIGWFMAMQFCLVLCAAALGVAGFSWWQEEADNAVEIVQLLGWALFFGVGALICRAHRRKAAPPLTAQPA